MIACVAGLSGVVIGLLNNGKRWAKTLQTTQHAPVTFIAIDVAADVLIVRVVLRANNLLMANLKI